MFPWELPDLICSTKKLKGYMKPVEQFEHEVKLFIMVVICNGLIAIAAPFLMLEVPASTAESDIIHKKFKGLFSYLYVVK